MVLYEIQLRVFTPKHQRVNYLVNFTRQEKWIIVFWVAIGFPAWLLLYYSMEVLPVGLAETI